MKRLEYLIEKFYKMADKIGMHNVILIGVIAIAIIITGLYSTFSLFSISQGIESIDGILTYKFILSDNMNGTSVVVPAYTNKHVDLVVKNSEDANLYYGIYYSTEGDINIGTVANTLYPSKGLINKKSAYTINLKISNNSSDDVTVDLGLIYGLENGGELILGEGLNWVEVYPDELADYIKTLYNDGSAIKTVNIGGDSTKPTVKLNENKGIMIDNNDEYRYYGENPNNYVWYNDELWRIISVSNVKSSEKDFKGETRVKIVKNSQLTAKETGTSNDIKYFAYDSNSNDWSKSDLMTELNDLYYYSTSGTCYATTSESYGPHGYVGGTSSNINCDFTDLGLDDDSRILTDNSLFYLGGFVSGPKIFYVDDYYNFERGKIVFEGHSTFWIGTVGVMYLSDYLYATDLLKCLEEVDNYDEDVCATNNWLHFGIQTMSITVDGSSNKNIFHISNKGYVNTDYSVVKSVVVKPVVYLKSDVIITGGEGTVDKPYQISLPTTKGDITTINFDTPNGSLDVKSKFVAVNEMVGTLPTPVVDGLVFVGWYTEPTGGKKITEETIVESSVEQTLYARWVSDVVNVEFDANGGVLSGDTTKELFYDTPYGDLPVPTKEQYVFDGWYTSIDGGELITSSSIVNFTGTQKLYARWFFEEINVTFNPTDGTLVDSTSANRTVVFGQIYGALPELNAREGYKFEGWYTEQTGGNLITENTIVSLKEATTLYARWTANKFFITFDANGGAGGTLKEVTYGQTYGKLATAVWEGHTFNGWYTSAIGGTQVKANDIVNLTGNITLYAHWTAIEYVVTFDANGGSVSTSSTQVVYDSKYGNSLPTPTKSGYMFAYWVTESGSPVTSETIVKTAANHTLYAKWQDFNVYVDGVNGKDSNNGYTPDQAVLTLKQAYTVAKSLSENNNISSKNGTIFVVNSVSVSSAMTLDKTYYQDSSGTISLATGDTISIKRYVNPNATGLIGYSKATNYNRLFIVKSGGNLTLKTVTIDGHNVDSTGDEYVAATGITSKGSIVHVATGGVLNIEGATLQHNTIYGEDNSYVWLRRGAAVCNVYGEVNMTSGTITNNNARHGGGIYNIGTTNDAGILNLSGGVINGNSTSTGSGGGVYNNAGGSLTISGNVVIDGNVANLYAGGVMNYGGTLNITGGSIQHNSCTTYSGGGIYNGNNGTVTISGAAKILNNMAATFGGGIMNYATVNMNGGTISGNATDTYGGGIRNDGGTLSITGGTISNNIVDNGRGGGIYSTSNGVLSISESTSKVLINSNEAGTNGGGVYVFNGTANITGGTINENKANKSGGGLTVAADAIVNISGSSLISDNISSEFGGGISSSGLLTITGGTISSNASGQGGGGIYSEDNTLSLSNTSIINNESSASGGGIYAVTNAIVNIGDNVLISENTANTYGGGIWLSSTSTINVNKFSVTISKNIATNNAGGAMYVNGILNMLGGKITENKTLGGGGAGIGVNSTGTVTMTGGSISNNTANTSGGGIYSYGGVLNLSNVYLESNSSVNYGGGIFNANGGICTLGVSNYIGSNETNTGSGGGIYNAVNSTLNILSEYDSDDNVWHTSSIDKNTAYKYGGGIYNNGTMTIEHGTVISYNNAETESGGGIYADASSTLTLNGGRISYNTAAKYGGGIGNTGVLNFEYDEHEDEYNGPLVFHNTATANCGGGIYNEGNLEIEGGAIRENITSASAGAGICNGISGTLTMTGGDIIGNTAETGGGGIYNAGNSTVNISGTIVIGNNTASSRSGGGINNEAVLNISGDVSIDNNTASRYGGGIYNTGTFTLSGNALIAANIAENNYCGQGVYNSNVLTMTGGTISSNGNSTVTSYGGGVCNAGNFDMSAGIIDSNWAVGGGGVYNGEASSVMNLSGTAQISNNRTISSSGGGISNVGGATLIMSGGAIIGNIAANNGGGVYNGTSTDTSVFTITGGSITNNTANGSGGGGGVFSEATFNNNGGTIENNTAPNASSSYKDIKNA